MKSIAVLLNLLHYFYHEIQCDKTCNFVHGEELKYSTENANLGMELKRHTDSITKDQFASNFLSMSSKLCF